MAVLRIHDAAGSIDRPIRLALVEARAEFAPTLESDPRFNVTPFASLPELLESTHQPDFELVVVRQTFSDQFAPGDVERLIVRFPLARLICVYGPLCQADGRRREIWPLPVRIPDWAFAGRLEREVAVLRNSAASLPLTATREETVRFDTPTSANWAIRPGISGSVFSGDIIWVETIRLMLAERTDGIWLGCESPEAIGSGTSDVCIVDLDPFSPALEQALEKLAGEHQAEQATPALILITSFPAKVKQIPVVARLQAGLLYRLDLEGLAAALKRA